MVTAEIIVIALLLSFWLALIAGWYIRGGRDE